MVPQPDDKRAAISRSTGTPFNRILITELGVSMGLQHCTDRTQLLLANGIVVPRISIGPLLPPHFIPFNWKSKPVITLTPHYDSTQVEVVEDAKLILASNNPIQLPSLSPLAAINITTPITPTTPLPNTTSSHTSLQPTSPSYN